MSNPDVYFKKTVKYRYGEHNFEFRVSQALFSSYDIDLGTQRLLRTFFSEKLEGFNKVLDLGCGYGPIGIALKRVFKPDIVHMVDRDALALEYSRQNAELNGIKDIGIYGSLGYDDVSDDNFDLIVSNVPAKVGDKALEHMLLDSKFHLRDGGRVAIVVIDAIAEYTEQLLTNPNIRILSRKAWPGHIVFHYEFSKKSPSERRTKQKAFDRGIFDREEKRFSFGNIIMDMITTYSLPEFDTLSFETVVLLNSLRFLQNRKIDKAIVFNIGQGHIPVALSLLSDIQNIFLIDRDLQALRVSKRNLILNKFSHDVYIKYQVGLSLGSKDYVDCIIGLLREEDGPIVHRFFLEQAISQLKPNGIMVLSSSSTAITRIEKFVHTEKLLVVSERQRLKGTSAIIFKKGANSH